MPAPDTVGSPHVPVNGAPVASWGTGTVAASEKQAFVIDRDEHAELSSAHVPPWPARSRGTGSLKPFCFTRSVPRVPMPREWYALIHTVIDDTMSSDG